MLPFAPVATRLRVQTIGAVTSRLEGFGMWGGALNVGLGRRRSSGLGKVIRVRMSVVADDSHVGSQTLDTRAEAAYQGAPGT